tara:strand:+ start:5201 stop:5500 length:300 start_codon:yes stop_codon:yes gene_type:complete
MRSLLEKIRRFEEYSYETAPYCGHHYSGSTDWWGFVKARYLEGEGTVTYGWDYLPQFCRFYDGSWHWRRGILIRGIYKSAKAFRLARKYGIPYREAKKI